MVFGIFGGNLIIGYALMMPTWAKWLWANNGGASGRWVDEGREIISSIYCTGIRQQLYRFRAEPSQGLFWPGNHPRPKILTRQGAGKKLSWVK